MRHRANELVGRVDGVFDELSIPETGTDGTIESAVSFFFIFVGIIAVIMIIIGGYRYVFSAGDPQRTKQAKDTIMFAVIGLGVSVSAWAIIEFVLG